MLRLYPYFLLKSLRFTASLEKQNSATSAEVNIAYELGVTKESSASAVMVKTHQRTYTNAIYLQEKRQYANKKKRKEKKALGKMKLYRW